MKESQAKEKSKLNQANWKHNIFFFFRIFSSTLKILKLLLEIVSRLEYNKCCETRKKFNYK